MRDAYPWKDKMNVGIIPMMLRAAGYDIMMPRLPHAEDLYLNRAEAMPETFGI